MLSDYNYEDYLDSPQQLAKRIVDKLSEGDELKFPLDPFELLSNNGISYQFRDFEKLEGIYIVPESEDDIPIIGININRPITRQRFTVAHEFCHHIKDRSSSACPILGNKNRNEKFADDFASEFLMPRDYFNLEVKKVIKNGFVSFDDALKLSVQFGVSFTSCVFTLAYRYGKSLIDGNIGAKEIKKRIKKYKPDKKRAELKLNSFEPEMREQIINSYSYFFEHDCDFIWHKFKNEYIYNENRIEGGKLDKTEVSEIVTDLRLHKQESCYCKTELQDIIETAGQSALYDFIFEVDHVITGFSILKLHAMLYQYAPYPEAGGKIRDSNNFVTDSKFETCDSAQIANEIYKLDIIVKELVLKCDSLSVAEFVEEAVRIHYRITVIHPFHDGNGRISRVFLNWLFRLKELPPVYLKYNRKDDYYEALQIADLENDFIPLYEVFFNEILRSMTELHDGRRITYEGSE
jgi:Zn-dependent peptidase ImmA (M78 family)/fido (protein-threonine AMPylation protein)